MNDPKERVHSAAATCISILGRRCYEAEGAHSLASSSMSVKGKEKEGLAGMWERCLKEVLAGKGARGKLEGIKLIASIRAEEGSKMPLKPWLAPLVDLLEDGDGPVREQAREVSISKISAKILGFGHHAVPSFDPASSKIRTEKATSSSECQENNRRSDNASNFQWSGPASIYNIGYCSDYERRW